MLFSSVQDVRSSNRQSSITKSSDVALIKKRLYDFACNRLYRHAEFSKKKMNYILAHFDGQKWTDINYHDNSAAAWEPAEHWERLYEMTYAFNCSKSQYYHVEGLKTKILSGIRYWLNANSAILCPNYWWNAIGVPLDMGKVLILMEPYLSASDIKSAIKIMSLGIKPDYYDYHGIATGQNLLWLANVHIYTSCLANDTNGLKRAFSAVSNEIRLSDAEGIQLDFSFQQHGPDFYSFGYGRTFTLTAAQLIYLAHSTSYAFSPKKIDIIARYILEGQQWMTKNKYLEYTAMGREISRGYMGVHSILIALKLMAVCDPNLKPEFNAFYNQLSTGKRQNPLVGNRYFPRVDFMVQQRKCYYFSIKGASNRVIGSESGNGENLKGYYLGQGTYYLIRKGNEYNGIFPVWNWNQLPGSLCLQNNQPLPLIDWGANTRGTTSFVYGLSDGMNGLFGYDYHKNQVRAKRAWFLFNRTIVCAVTGIESPSMHHLFQTLNQTILQGNVLVNNKKQSSAEKSYDSHQTLKVYQDSVGYFTHCAPYPVIVKRMIPKGTWKSINVTGSADTVAIPVFTMNIDLGTQVRNGSFYYAIVPCLSKTAFENYQLDDHISILSNDTTVQAVYEKSMRQMEAVFYHAGKVKLPWKGLTLTFLKPGLCMIKEQAGKLIIHYAQPSDKKELVVKLYPKFNYKNGDIMMQ
jgi:chondroitin AC lyase